MEHETVTIKLNPQREKPVMGVKIIDEEYADSFVTEGIVHFSNPKTWRDSNQCSGMQLDEKDGCFCFSLGEKDELFNKNGRSFEKRYSNGGWCYFEKTDFIVGTCFYGINRSDFQYFDAQYGTMTIPSEGYTIPGTYFDRFKEAIDDNRKVVLVFDLWKFINMLKQKAVQMGASEEEINAFSVYYVNKTTPYATTESFPFEYFLKDKAFSIQSEFRIIIASKNKAFYERLRRNGNNISIGDISSISAIQDNYSSGLSFSIQGNKLLYELSTPKKYTLDEMAFDEVVGILYQILQNRLPGAPKERNEIEELIKPIIEHLKVQYGVEYKDDWRLYNVPEDEYKTLPDKYKGMCETIINPAK